MKWLRPSGGFLWMLLASAAAASLAWLSIPAVPMEGYQGKPVEEWFDELLDFEPAEAFAELGTNAVPFLRPKLAKHDDLRNQVVTLLRRATPKRWAARLPQSTSAAGGRQDAAFALWWMGPDAALPERDLLRALEDDSEDVQHYAAIMLGERGTTDGPLLATCRGWLQDSNRTEQALRILAVNPALVRRIDPEQLLRVFREKDNEFAIIACARLYEATRDPRLLECFQEMADVADDSDAALFGAFERWWTNGEDIEGLCVLYAGEGGGLDDPALMCASDRLQQLEDAALLPSPGRFVPEDVEARRIELIAALSALQDEWMARMGAHQFSLDGYLVEVEILSNLPDVKPGFVPILRRNLKDREFLGRLHAARALGRVGPAASAAIPDLRQMLRHECLLDRIGAAEALWRIERRKEEVLPVLEACLNAPGARVRGTAGRALLVVEQDAPGTLPLQLRQRAQQAFARSSVPSVMGILLRLQI